MRLASFRGVCRSVSHRRQRSQRCCGATSHAPLASGLPEKPDLSEENAKSCKNSQQPVPPWREMSHPSSSAYVFAAESSSLLMRRARNRSPCIARSLLLAPLPRVDAFLERSRACSHGGSPQQRLPLWLVSDAADREVTASMPEGSLLQTEVECTKKSDQQLAVLEQSCLFVCVRAC